MVAYVYKMGYYGTHKSREKVMHLPAAGNRCEVGDYYDGTYSAYDCEVTIGNSEDYILLKGVVVHKLVRAIMKGTSKKTKRAMIDYLESLLEDGGEGNNDV